MVASLESASSNGLPITLGRPHVLDLVFLTIGTIGLTCDILGVSLAGANVRVFQLFFVLVCMLRPSSLQVSLHVSRLLYFFLLCAIPSLFVSQSALKSFAYVAWILFNYHFIFSYYANFSRRYPRACIDVYLNVSRALIVASFVSHILGLQERGNLLFYEASYFAMFLSLFVAHFYLVSGSVRMRCFDLILLLMFYSASQSGAFLLINAFAIFAYLCIKARQYPVRIILAFAFLVMSGVTVVLNSSDDSDLNVRAISATIDAADASDAATILLLRGGNRLGRTLQAVDIILTQPLLGVGLGAYEAYLVQAGSYSYRDLEVNLAEEDSGDDKPPINILLEIAATGGIIAALAFVVFTAASFSRKIFKSQYLFVAIGALDMLFALMFESNYLRLYFWALLGIVYGIGRSLVTSSHELI